MALIDQATQPAYKDDSTQSAYPPPPEAAGEAPQEAAGQSIAPEKVKQMQDGLAEKVPPNLKGAYVRIVMAGKKIMYSEKSTEMVKTELNRPAPIDQKLAHAATGMILMMDKESKGTMPQDAAVLAGACLLLEMVDLVLKIGMPVTEQDVRDALDTFVTLVMMKHGAKEPEIMGALGVKGQGQPKPAAPVAAPAAPPAAPAASQGY